MIGTTRGCDPHDHLCLAYADPGEFHSQLLEFLADGLALGRRVCYAAYRDTAALWGDLQDLDETKRSRRPGAVQVQSLDDPTSTVVRPVDLVQGYAAATEDALAAGFTGLRVAIEATPLVRSPEQLDAFARFEHLIDRYMTSRPFSALCAYNRGELGEETIAAIACLHPTANGVAAPFRLHASTRAVACLGGELDLTSRELFPMALRRVDIRPTDGELVIDATGLDFIDHHSMLALADYARSIDATVVLRTDLPSPARIIEILDLLDMQVEPSV
ncbi:MAG: MEDS domain-containing protein [Pseudonocardiaceae bacterium]